MVFQGKFSSPSGKAEILEQKECILSNLLTLEWVHAGREEQ